MQQTGKNKRRQFEVYDIIHNVNLSVDSQEEVDFIEWCNEATKLSIINDYFYQPESYQLAESVKYKNVFNKENTLFQEHKYSPDFIIMFDPNNSLDLSKEFHIMYDDLSSQQCSSIIDVKGTFTRNDGGRSFSINQKWMYQKFKLYIYKLIPQKFFAKFGCPDNCKLTKKTKKPRTVFKGFKSIKEIFKIK